MSEIALEMAALDDRLIPTDEVAEKLADFDPVWETLTARERIRVVRLLVQSVEFDGQGGSVSVTFHSTGIGALENALEATA